MCYTLRSGWSYAVAVYTTPHDVYAFLRPIATFYLSAIAIYRMPHSSHVCLTLRFCQLLQYSLRLGYIACRCICFAIIVFYTSEIYCPIFKLSSTMPSILHILVWSSIGLRSVILLIRILIVAIHPLISVDITCSQVKLQQFSRRPSWQAGGGDGITLVAFITFILPIPAATWHPDMQYVICAIVVYRVVCLSASDLKFLKHHVGGQIVMKNRIINTPCFHADDHGRSWVLRLLVPTLDCSKSVFIHPLLVALR